MPDLSRSVFGLTLLRWIVLVAIGIGLLSISIVVRNQLDIEWSVQSLRDFVQTLGIWGPLAYVGILTFRFVFLIPTGLLLLAAGIMFGPVQGTLYAGLGMTGSGLLKYGFTLIIGRDVVLHQLPPRLQSWVEEIATRKMSFWALGGVCAYPFFPKHVFQFAAILSGMSFLAYVSAVIVGSFVRAAIFSNVGESIYSGAGLIATTSILLAGLILPMCVPSWRRWMLAPLSSTHSSNPSAEISP
jgi:uncharacterized membrane protein YdjX (TVP38/TMEM64 family)